MTRPGLFTGNSKRETGCDLGRPGNPGRVPAAAHLYLDLGYVSVAGRVLINTEQRGGPPPGIETVALVTQFSRASGQGSQVRTSDPRRLL